MNDIKVSVIVPIYKIQEKVLKKCIDSIINQTLEKIEIILVNDGSPDNCGKVCDEYAKLDKRILVIHKTNGGVSSARNIGILKAKGIYIGFVDADDWIEKDFYKKMIDYAEKNVLDVVVSGFIKSLGNNKSWSLPKFRNMIFNSVEAKFKLLERKVYGWSPCDKIYRKSIVQNKIFFDEKIKMGEDLDFCWNVLTNIEKMGYIYLNKYHYCYRKNSVTKILDPEKKWDSVKVMRKILLSSTHLDNKIKNRIKALYVKEMASSNIDMILTNNNKYESKIKLFQSEIRRNFFQALRSNFNLKIKLGICITSLPYIICKYILYFMHNRERET